ncbi:hypothetical protein [Microbulbifer sp. ALW1]|uniref:hypothetical protein n=1 Tax=Microbulbifer sp. (strain ALW1) TaxID=1516059 RepID=UPI001356DB84|nr:hypothetical protein [Microbulbifer sp. ALW1]
MDWEIVNGVTGLVSASMAILGIFQYRKISSEVSQPKSGNRSQKFYAFWIASAGWALCCLSYLWLIQPYGMYPSDREYKQFFGIVLGFPALVIFLYGVNLLQGEQKNA